MMNVNDRQPSNGENRTTSLLSMPGQQRPRELEAIRARFQNSDLPIRERWRLSKDYQRTLEDWFHTEMELARRVAQANAQGAANIRLKQIAQYASQCTLELRGQYLATMSDLGLRVEQNQIEFGLKAAQTLSDYVTRVTEAKIDVVQFKERLIEMIYRTFDRMMSGLNSLTDDLLKGVGDIDDLP